MSKGTLGKPKYTYDDVVSFKIIDGEWLSGTKAEQEYVLTGKVYIIDSYGTFEQNEEPSYDIMVEEGDYPISYPCLFKHIRESSLC